MKKLLIALAIFATFPLTAFAANVSVPQSTAYGQLLVGNASGGNYTPTATSSVQFFNLTTIGSSGAATYSSGVLNIPQYSGGSGTSGTATSSFTATYPIKVTTSSSAINYSLLNMATTTVSCSGTASCTPFTVIGSSPITITGSAGMSASSTLLTDNNTFTGTNVFSNAASTFAGTWQGYNASTFNNKVSSTSLSVTTIGSSGAATYTPSTGVFNIPQYSGGTTYTGTYPIIVTGSVISTGISTSTITNLPNLVQTGTITSGTWNGTAIADSYIASASTWNAKMYPFATSTLSASSPLTGSFIQVGSGGSLGCQTASGLQAGCLSSTDWTTFNNKGSGTVTSIAAGTGLNGGTINSSGTLSLKSYFGTTTADTANQVPYWSSTNATPATFASNAAFIFNPTGTLLTITNASSTNTASTNSWFTNSTIGTLTLTNKLTVAYGGTNATSFTTSGNSVYWNGTSLVTSPTTAAVTTPNASTTNLTSVDDRTSAMGSISPLRIGGFKLATTTAWTGKTTEPYSWDFPAPFTGTTKTETCYTDTGTVEVKICDNSTCIYFPASSTAATYSISLAMTANDKMSGNAGAPASTPTWVTCALGGTQN